MCKHIRGGTDEIYIDFKVFGFRFLSGGSMFYYFYLDPGIPGIKYLLNIVISGRYPVLDLDPKINKKYWYIKKYIYIYIMLKLFLYILL